MYVRGYLQGSENDRVVTIGKSYAIDLRFEPIRQRLCACSAIVLMKKTSQAKKLKPGPNRKLSDYARKEKKKQRMLS